MPHIESTADSLARIKRQGESPRYWRLNLLEAIWKGKRYEVEGRPSFWEREVPLQERAPCIVYPIARSAGNRIVTLVFGERSFPKVLTDTGAQLSKENATLLGRLLTSIIKQARLSMRMREALEQGLMVGTVVPVVSLKRGKVCVDLIPAKWCRPKFDPATGELAELDIRYRYQDPEGTHCWYRRTITATADTTYLPVECTPDDREPLWAPDPAKTFALEMMPALWHRNQPDCGDSDVDGNALHEGLEDEMEGLDFSLSQRHRNARYNGEPFIARMGVDGPSTGANGRTADPVPFPFGRPHGSKPAIKKAPGTLWDLPQGADVKMVESSGAGATILNTDAAELRRMILEVMQAVMADPETLGSGDLSARALTILMGPMLALCDNLRVEYGDLLIRILQKILRLLLTTTATENGVALDGLDEARPLIAGLIDRLDDVPLDLTWGEYFPPSSTEVQAKVDTARKAAGDRAVASHRTAVRSVAGVLDVDDVDAELAAIEADDAAGQGALRETFGALGDRSPAANAAAPPKVTDGA